MATLLLTVSLAWAGDCRPVSELTEGARQAMLAADLEAAHAQVGLATEALGCGEVVSRETLAGLWIVEGVLAGFDGRDADVLRPFRAAAGLAPERWEDTWGDALTSVWAQAREATTEPPGTLELAPALGAGWTVFVDGVATPLPATIPAGLHAVQIADAGRVRHGVVVLVPATEAVRVSHQLPPTPPKEVPVASPPAAGATVQVRPYGAAGVDGSFGEPVTATSFDPREPGTKVVVPIELGGTLRTGPLWLRGTAAAAPLLGGPFVYRKGQDADAEPGRSPVAVGAAFALGGSVGRVDAGVSFGAQWPSRLPARVVVSTQLGKLPLRLEARGGLNVVTDRPAEPAFGLLLAFSPKG